MTVATSSTSIILTWDPPPIHERNGIIITYTINQVVAGNISTLNTTALMITINNLRPFTSYSFDVAALTSVGRGPSTAAITETTLEDGM